MSLSDYFDIPAMRTTQLQMKKLEEAAIDRARLYLEAEGKPYESFKNDNGFSVRVQMDSLLDEDSPTVIFYQRDEQGHGDTHTISIPREVILGPLTAKEQDFVEYNRLKAQFEK